MKKYFIIVLFIFLTWSSYARYYGYQGKIFDISFVNAMMMPLPPLKFTTPITPSVELSMAFSRHFGIGASIGYENVYVNYDFPESEFIRNHYLNTIHSSVHLRCYTRSFIAPAGDYFQLSFGKIAVIPDAKDEYSFATEDYYSSQNGNGITPASKLNTIYTIPQPPINDYYFISIGFYKRFPFKKVKNLMVDVGGKGIINVGGYGVDPHERSTDVKTQMERNINIISHNGIKSRNKLKLEVKIAYIF